MKITGAIFDMDGTLLNSMDYWGVVAGEYLLKKGITPTEDTNCRFLSDGMKSWYEYCVKEYGLSEDFDTVKKEIYSEMDKKYKTVVQLKDGAGELLERLSENGVKMCLATATDRETVNIIIEKLGLKKYFSKIFTSGEVGLGKRFPKIYELALEYLGTDRETTYVFEDAHYAIVTAHENGFKVVGVYDKNVFVPKEEVKALCDIYLDEGSKYALDIE